VKKFDRDCGEFKGLESISRCVERRVQGSRSRNAVPSPAIEEVRES